MKSLKNNLSTWTVRIIGILIGFLIIQVYQNTDINFHSLLLTIYHRVGITIIALVPLSLWAVYTAVKTEKGSEFTLAYIGATAQRVGLLGTVIGIVAATVSIGDNLSSGAAGAVTGALPAVGQALVSTAVGFVIAITCDFFIYINSKKAIREDIKNVRKE
ncbi:MAG: MotA/TolQ/ExbB proton channel family protein [bacterium]|nr:MotA/TolQ/ExbB proton channel family protein [bacterium]